MISAKLTNRAGAAHKAPMETRKTGLARAARVGAASAAALAMCGMLAGCITIKAPEDKIVIELNINIQQEVLYKIANDVDKTIEENSGIF